jgi:hypothetical protein
MVQVSTSSLNGEYLSNVLGFVSVISAPGNQECNAYSTSA